MIVEVCAGSLSDCIVAQQCGAQRIELNSGLFLGGLTASVAVLAMAKAQVDVPIMCMVRPRGAGFCYNRVEKQVMLKEAELLLNHGADGIVFGCLNEDKQVDVAFTKEMVQLISRYRKEIVFHRAFDVACSLDNAVQVLIDLGVHRILTSGAQTSAWEGREQLKALYQCYGTAIEFCMGAGINADNIVPLIETTGILQCHASFKGWRADKTTAGNGVDYSYGQSNGYDVVDANVLRQFMAIVNGA